MALTQYLYFPFFLCVCARGVHKVEADSFRERGEVRCVCLCVCVLSVLAGVSDNEMQQGTKSWGPLFSVLQLHFHSRQSMILPYPLSCVHVSVCVCLCLYELLVVRMSVPSSSC